MKYKKQQLGENSFLKNYSETQLREIIIKFQAKEANYKQELLRLKEQNLEIVQKYHKALKQIGEMEKLQKRDQMYIMQIDGFLLEAKKRFEENKKQQTDQYVDALSEITRQRDDYLKRNIQLEIQINDLQEQIEKFKSQSQIIPSASQQQFSNPLTIHDEISCYEANLKTNKKYSINSMNTQDSIIHEDEKDDQLMNFLHQLDEQQANQLYNLFCNNNNNNVDFNKTQYDENAIKKILTENSSQLGGQASSFSFSNKWDENKENHFF